MSILEGDPLLEEVDEEPYRLTGCSNHLRMAGSSGIRGMVVGRLHRCVPTKQTPGLPLAEILTDHLKEPVPGRVDFPRATRRESDLPLGLRAPRHRPRLLEILP